MATSKLNITFHNPNAPDVLIRELILLSAEIVNAKVNDTLLHMAEIKAEQE